MNGATDAQEIEQKTDEEAKTLKPTGTNVVQPEVIVKRRETQPTTEEIEGQTTLSHLQREEDQGENRANQKDQKKKEKQTEKGQTSEPKTVEKKNKERNAEEKIEKQMPFQSTDHFQRMIDIEIEKDIDQQKETVTAQVDASAKGRFLTIVTHRSNKWFNQSTFLPFPSALPSRQFSLFPSIVKS